MKIGIYVGELDVKGGTHKQVLRLAQHLVETGHDVTIWSPFYDLGRTYAEFAALDVRTIENARPGRILPYLRLALRLPQLDVLNIHDNRGVVFFFAARLLRRARVYIWQINDIHPSFGRGNGAGLRRRRRSVVHRVLNRLMARHVDAVTVNVTKNAARVAELLHVPARVIYCGVDLPPPSPEPDDVRSIETARLPTAPHRVLSTGAFMAYRNYERLIEGAELARRELGREIEVTIVGDTRYEPAYAQRIQALAREHAVPLRIRENLSDAELAQEVSACEAFIFINVDQSWGLAVFEAAAAGKPVVLSNSVGAAEVLSGKPGILLVDPLSASEVAGALVGLLGDAVAREALGRSARAAVQDMTWPNTYGRPFEQLCAGLLRS